MIRFPLFILPLFLLCSSVEANKYKLSDVKEEVPDEPVGGESTSKIDHKKLAAEVAEEFYEKGMVAMEEGRLEQAEGFFDRALILNPEHRRAKRGIEMIMQRYEDSLEKEAVQVKTKKAKLAPDPKIELKKKLTKDLKLAYDKQKWDSAHSFAEQILALDPHNAYAKAKLKQIDRKQRAVKRQQEKVLKKESEEFYLAALKASQNGDNELAMENCQKALALNPNNLQARRMLGRLKSLQ